MKEKMANFSMPSACQSETCLLSGQGNVFV